MPQGRIILKSICQSKKMADLKTDTARLLYTWLIPNLDVNGCFSGDPDVIKGQIFTRLKKSDKVIESCLKELEENGLIVRYKTNGDIYLQVPDFVDKQPSLNPSKEGVPTIPVPTPEQLQSNSDITPPKVKESKVKESKGNNTDVDSIFNHWNKHKGKPWKSHKKLSPEIAEAIKLRLKTYTVEELSKAIDNYAMILKEKDYQWSYAWSLRQFLTRHRPDDRKELQLYRWLDNSFEASDYLTDSAKRSRGRLGIKKSEGEKQPEAPFDAKMHWRGMGFDEAVDLWKRSPLHQESIKTNRPDWLKIKEAAKGVAS